MFKLKIKTKMIVSILGLPLISILIFYYGTHQGISILGEYSIRNSANLGDTAALDSEIALKEQARGYLFQTAMNQAAISNALFEKVETEVEVSAWYASFLWSNPSQSKPTPYYTWKDSPSDPNAFSVCRIAPTASMEKIKQDIRISANIDKLFKSIRDKDRNIKSIYIGTESGLHRRLPWTSKRKKSYDPRKRSWYKKAVNSGKIGWTDLYISASEEILMVTCFKPVYDRNKRLIGVIGVDVTLLALNEKIISTQIGDHGYALLIDKKGKVIAHPKLTKGEQKWDETFKTENWLESNNEELKKIGQDMVKGKGGIQLCFYDGGNKFIAYAPLKTTNWSIGIVMPVDEIIKPAQNTKNKIISVSKDARKHIQKYLTKLQQVSIYLFVGMIIIITIVAIKLSKTITKPILALNNGAQIIGRGKLEHRLQIETGDELQDLANAFNKMAEDLIIYIKDLQETTAAKEKIESELQIATEIQASMLPRIFPPFPDRKEFNIYATMEPAKEVGGDFYDFFFTEKNKLCFLIADVSGKGVPAALFMVISKTLLKTAAMLNLAPDEILRRVNDLLCPDNDECMFVTVFCAILDTHKGELEYANAGHNPPLIYTGGEKFEYLKIGKSFVLGAMQDMTFKSEKLILKPNDIFFMYTDGVTEAINPNEELFEDERLQKAISKLKDENLPEMIKGIREEIKAFEQGAPQFDDITMLALKYKG